MGEREKSEEKKCTTKIPIASMQEADANAPLLNQMKTEIRRLYGEKVNMVNTNYMMKPHEFKCLMKSLTKALGNPERKLETVDDLIYAVDLLCNKQANAVEKQNERELRTTVRFIASELKTLLPFPEKEAGESTGDAPLSEVLKNLTEVKDRIKKELEICGHGTIELLVREKSRAKNLLEKIQQEFSISPSEDLINALRSIKIKEERKYKDELLLKDKTLHCQKKYYEEALEKAEERIVLVESKNKELLRRVHEREERRAEVLERGDALEQNILQIKQVLAEEEKRIQQEREEYRTVKKTLIDYNKKMAKIVQDLVERIKREQKERDKIIELQEQ